MRSSQWWSKRTPVRSRFFETNPFEDRLAATLLVGGWLLAIAGIWWLGRIGGKTDRYPDFGGYGWLIVALLLLVAALSARWAIRRAVEQGSKPVCLWLRVRRTSDDAGMADGGNPYAWPDGFLIFLICLGCSTLTSLHGAGYYFGTSTIPWIIVGAMVAGGAVQNIWIHLRVRARPDSTHGVEHISDGYAQAAAWVAEVLAILSVWMAGLIGIPTTAGGDPPLVPRLFILAGISLSLVCIWASVARTRQIANSPAIAVTEAELV